MFLDWKFQLEKIQLTRDLSLDFILYQGLRLPNKICQFFCNPTTWTQATIDCFPEDTCTTFQVAKNQARMVNFHKKNYRIKYYRQKYPWSKQIKPTEIKKIKMIKKKKLTIFQVYTETEIVCKYPEPLFRTQYSEHFVEYEKSFNIKNRQHVFRYSTSISK